MGGHLAPIRCCDGECAAVNHCSIGGTSCEGCGLWFCDFYLDENGYCGKCAAKYEAELEEESEEEA